MCVCVGVCMCVQVSIQDNKGRVEVCHFLPVSFTPLSGPLAAHCPLFPPPGKAHRHTRTNMPTHTHTHAHNLHVPTDAFACCTFEHVSNFHCTPTHPHTNTQLFLIIIAHCGRLNVLNDFLGGFFVLITESTSLRQTQQCRPAGAAGY